MPKQLYSSGTPWEPIAGYSRAVKVGNQIFISGTTATDDEGNIVGINDPYLQTKQTLSNIEKALNALGSSFENVVRTRMFVTQIDQWEDIAKAHGEIFKEIRPATTMVEVSNLINSDMLIEIETDAIIEN